MKNVILTLSALALAVNSASAYTLVNNENSGTKLDLNGSARFIWNSSASKQTDANGNTTRQHINRAVANNTSRFGFRLTQQLGNGVYALGHVEWRARGRAASQHNFDEWYTRQLYAGIGHKQYGELTYGNQGLITDEVKQTDLANTLSLSGGLLAGAARRSLQYTYKGIDGLKVGAYYAGKSPRGDDGLDLADKRKDVRGAAAIYTHKIDEQQKFTVAAGASFERFYNGNTTSVYDRDAYGLGTAYTFANTTVGLDLERRTTENQGAAGNKRTQKEVRTIVFQKLTGDWNAYAMYAYKTNKLDRAVGVDTKAKTNQFMIGSEYWIAKDLLAQYQLRAKTFVEWQTSRTKNSANGINAGKTRNNETVVGFRLFW